MTDSQTDVQGTLFRDVPLSFAPPGLTPGRIGVVDVGSNSVRLVVFDGGSRCPSVVFNEKVMCGLGRKLAETSRLDPDGVVSAMAALIRFAALAPGLRVEGLSGVATAAIRDAEDGPDFRDRVQRETGIRLRVASGADEARLAALGVLFGDPQATGTVVDLGGASMELCRIADGRPGPGVSTPLGPQRLEKHHGRPSALAAIVRNTLAPLIGPNARTGERLYLVGGAWRALARAEMARSDYPLDVLHEYVIAPRDAAALARWARLTDPEDLAALSNVPSSRVWAFPYSGLLLAALLDTLKPTEVQISAFGLREGVCLETMPEKVWNDDPLIAACRAQERRRARAPGFGDALRAWLGPILAPCWPADPRILHAACLLTDVSWQSHPSYRARNAWEAAMRVTMSGIGHAGRVFLAATLFTRNRGGRKALEREPALALLSDEEREAAIRAGLLLRLGCTAAACAPGVLDHLALGDDGTDLTLTADAAGEPFLGEDVQKRLAQAAKAMGRNPAIRVDAATGTGTTG